MFDSIGLFVPWTQRGPEFQFKAKSRMVKGRVDLKAANFLEMLLYGSKIRYTVGHELYASSFTRQRI